MSTDPLLFEHRLAKVETAAVERERVERSAVADAALTALIVAVELAWFAFVGLVLFELVR